jgi:hypothetical protein
MRSASFRTPLIHVTPAITPVGKVEVCEGEVTSQVDDFLSPIRFENFPFQRCIKMLILEFCKRSFDVSITRENGDSVDQDSGTAVQFEERSANTLLSKCSDGHKAEDVILYFIPFYIQYISYFITFYLITALVSHIHC